MSETWMLIWITLSLSNGDIVTRTHRFDNIADCRLERRRVVRETLDNTIFCGCYGPMPLVGYSL